MTTQKELRRCEWANKSQADMSYHDNEWGRVLKDESKFFEMISLECFQAGLSWSCVINKREAMREAFDGFDAEKIAFYSEMDVENFMQNDRLIKNRLKLRALISNAKIYLDIKSEFGGFYEYLWHHLLPQFIPNFDGKQIVNHFESISQIPSQTPLSEFIAKKLKKRGFKFLGPTSVYALLQGVGVVDDHLNGCFCKNVKKDKI